MTIKSIVFDIDGTILDTFAQNIYPLIQIVKEELNIDMTYDDLVHYCASPGHDVLRDLGIHLDHYPRWVEYVNQYPHKPEIFSGFDTVIKTLHDQNFPMGIVSSKRRKQYNIDFGENGLIKYFQHTILADDTEKHKPNAEPLLTCLNLMKEEPTTTIYVGDSYYDYLCAKAAGAKFALATWGNLSREGMDEIDYVLESPLDLLEILNIK